MAPRRAGAWLRPCSGPRPRVLVALMVIVGSHDDPTSGRQGQQAKEAKLPRSRLHDPLRSTSRGRALHYQVDHFRMRRDRFHHGDSNHSQEGQHFDCPRTSFLAASRRLLPSPELRLNHTAPLQLQHSACTPPRINYAHAHPPPRQITTDRRVEQGIHRRMAVFEAYRRY